MLDELLENKEFSEKLLTELSNNETFKALFANDERFQKLLLSHEKFCHKIFSDQKLVSMLLNNEKFQNNILSNSLFQEKAAIDSRIQNLALKNQQMLNRAMANKEFLNQVKPILAKDGLFHEMILEDDKFFNAIVESPTYMAKLKANQHLASKFGFVQSWDKIQNLPYELPTYVVGYPRSGTNFIQSVMQGSTGIKCQSMYADKIDNSQDILSLKSHAFSKSALYDEIERLIPDISLNGQQKNKKIISIFRDPRDVMPSFYEFVAWRKKVKIPQSDFLKTCYFYATYQDRHKMLDRNSEVQSVNIEQAYKKHVANWFNHKNDKMDIYSVRYEDLLMEPEMTFKGIFDFLEMESSIDLSMLKHRVAEFSQTSRSRGVAFGWKKKQSQYGELIEKVSDKLKNQIKTLGYDV